MVWVSYNYMLFRAIPFDSIQYIPYNAFLTIPYHTLVNIHTANRYSDRCRGCGSLIKADQGGASSGFSKLAKERRSETTALKPLQTPENFETSTLRLQLWAEAVVTGYPAIIRCLLLRVVQVLNIMNITTVLIKWTLMESLGKLESRLERLGTVWNCVEPLGITGTLLE